MSKKEKNKTKKKPIKRKKVKKQKEEIRWSQWFLRAFFIALIGFVLYKGVPTFIKNNCMGCALPTLGIGGLISAFVLAVLNEVKNYMGK